MLSPPSARAQPSLAARPQSAGHGCLQSRGFGTRERLWLTGREMGAEGRTVGSDSCLELEGPSGIIYSKLLILCMGHLSLEKGRDLPQVTRPVTADPRTEEDLGSWILSFLLATVVGMTSCPGPAAVRPLSLPSEDQEQEQRQ